MTADEFELFRPRLSRLAPYTLQCVREVLVDGDSQAEVARRYGFSRQRVNLAVARVLAETNGVPASWKRVDVWLPPAEAVRVREIATEARRELKSREDAPAAPGRSDRPAVGQADPSRCRPRGLRTD